MPSTPSPAPSEVPAWVNTLETWTTFTGSVIGDLVKALGGKSSSTGSGGASTGSSGLGINLGVDPLPEITAGFSMLGAALNLADTFVGARSTPQYLAALALQQQQEKYDEINTALQTNDLDSLRRLSSL